MSGMMVIGGPPGAGAGVPLRGRTAGLRYIPRLIQLLWQTHRSFTLAVVALRLTLAVLPVVTLWVAKLIIDAVIVLARDGGSTRHLLTLVALELGVVAGTDVLSRVTSLVEGSLNEIFLNRVSIRIMEHAATLDLHQFENHAFYDHLERARQGMAGRFTLLAQLLGVAQSCITLVSLSALLIGYAPWLLLLLAVAVAPTFVSESHFAGLSYLMLFGRTPERRKLDYLRAVGSSNLTAKEVQLFGLSPWLIARYRALADKFYREGRALATRKTLVGSVVSLLGTAGYYAAYLFALLQAAAGAITVGTLTLLAAAFRQSRNLIQDLLTSASGIYEQTLYLKDLFAFFDMQPQIRNAANPRPVPARIRHGFTFENVGFRYPDTDRWALRGVSCELRVGERIALVGENGAGKTTMTKLIARLYDPTEGRILLDGVDLREYDLAGIRRAIGVLFQDFVRYDMRLDENIGLGEIDLVREYLDGDPTATVSVPDAIAASAEKSLADSLLPRLKGSYRHMLGKRFEGGAELSGGEWQKVALARAYMRDAQLIILDEPTASLDARAEFTVFERFNALMAGRMAVIISHRFSTVRMADRILVLKHGQLVEQGTHNALVGGPGLYSELFELQAASYR